MLAGALRRCRPHVLHQGVAVCVEVGADKLAGDAAGGTCSRGELVVRHQLYVCSDVVAVLGPLVVRAGRRVRVREDHDEPVVVRVAHAGGGSVSDLGQRAGHWDADVVTEGYGVAVWVLNGEEPLWLKVRNHIGDDLVLLQRVYNSLCSVDAVVHSCCNVRL